MIQPSDSIPVDSDHLYWSFPIFGDFLGFSGIILENREIRPVRFAQANPLFFRRPSDANLEISMLGKLLGTSFPIFCNFLNLFRLRGYGPYYFNIVFDPKSNPDLLFLFLLFLFFCAPYPSHPSLFSREKKSFLDLGIKPIIK